MSAQFSVVIFFAMQMLIILDNSDAALDVTVQLFENVWMGSKICEKTPGEYKYKIDDICVLLRGYRYVNAATMYSEATVRENAKCETKKVQLKNGDQTITKQYNVLMCTLNNQITGKMCVTRGKDPLDIITYNYDADPAIQTCIPFQEKKGVAKL